MGALTDLALTAQQRPAEAPMSGVVTAVSSTTLSVLWRGVTIDAAYLASYSPTVGDLVALARQDATVLVLGALAGVGPNAVQNFSFDDEGETESTPVHWTLYNIAGTSGARATATGNAVAGTFELAVTSSGGAADAYVYSDPIPVTPGEQWAISAYASSTDATADAALYALWFANSTDLYPITSAADTLVGAVPNVGPQPLHASVSGTVTVPGAAPFMRVATRSTMGTDITMYWDVVIARRVG